LIRVLIDYFFVILSMELFFSIIIIGIAIIGMSVGIIFNRKPLQGSCGGIASDCVCLKGGICDDPSQKPIIPKD
jgi:hypothetical protein